MTEKEGMALETTQLLPDATSDDVPGSLPRKKVSTCAWIGIAGAAILIAAAIVYKSDQMYKSDQVRSAGDNSVFPPDFIWGAATSSYQIEGGTNSGGRGPSIWENWCIESSDNCNGDTGEIGDDHYHLWREDIELMKSLGLKAYRFSISWSRILPEGTADYGGKKAKHVLKSHGSENIKGINYEGIKFYNDIINLLLEYDIEPFITLYHWDLPQSLQDRYGGWANRRIIEDFGDYARICYHYFGDRVRYWITINEGWTVAIHGYQEASNAPGFLGEDVGGNGKPYLVGHHLLLAHARAVEVFRKEGYSTLYERGSRNEFGRIGISNSGDYRFPLDPENEDDQEAATRAIEFQLGWMVSDIQITFSLKTIFI